MTLKDFKLAMLLMDWRIGEERRWCRWDKEGIQEYWYIKVDKSKPRPVISYVKQGGLSWHQTFAGYEDLFGYIVKEMI